MQFLPSVIINAIYAFSGFYTPLSTLFKDTSTKITILKQWCAQIGIQRDLEMQNYRILWILYQTRIDNYPNARILSKAVNLKANLFHSAEIGYNIKSIKACISDQKFIKDNKICFGDTINLGICKFRYPYLNGILQKNIIINTFPCTNYFSETTVLFDTSDTNLILLKEFNFENKIYKYKTVGKSPDYIIYSAYNYLENSWTGIIKFYNQITPFLCNTNKYEDLIKDIQINLSSKILYAMCKFENTYLERQSIYKEINSYWFELISEDDNNFFNSYLI